MPLSLPDRLLRRAARALLRSPVGLVGRLAGAPRRNDRDDALDVGAQLLLRLQAAAVPALDDPDPAQARADMRRSSAIAAKAPPAVVAHDATIDGPGGPIPIRRYTSAHAHAALVFFHGGGWAVGDLDTHDPLCRRVAAEAGIDVVSVRYRLAPEAPFPAARRDALAAYDALRASLSGPVGVGGDSAGGNLAALVANARAVDFQALIYPATDLRRLTASHRTLGQGYLLTSEGIDRYLRWYAAPPADPEASPALGRLSTAPAVVVTAGFDPLRDEGEAYAEALLAAGASVVDLRYPGLIHGFVNMDGLLPAADVAVGEIIAAIRHVSAPRDTVSRTEG